MYAIISKDNGKPTWIYNELALVFYRAFRAELWASGIKRDPKAGDELLGVKIIAINI